MNRALGGKTYAANSFGQWIVSSIRWSYIERIDYLNFDRDPTPPGACTVLGIYQPWQATFAPTTLYNPATDTSTYSNGQAYCSGGDHESRFVWVGSNAMPDGAGGDPEAADMSQGIFQLRSSAGARSDNAQDLLRGAKVYRYDRNAPNLTSSTPSSAWTQGPVSMSVHDDGLGAVGVWVLKAGTFNIVGTAGNGCGGGRQSLCPTDTTVQLSNLPEGRMDVVGVGVDPVLNGSAGQAWTARIDRSPPDLILSGTLPAVEGRAPTPSGNYSLGVTATDGHTDAPANERAGMASIEILVDDVRAAYQSQGCPAGSCPQSVTWTYDTAVYGAGSHAVTVIATDQIGHQTIDELTIGEEEVPFDGSIIDLSDSLDQAAFDSDPLPALDPDDPTFVEVSGTATDSDACRFNMEITLLPEQESATKQVVDYDADTCSAVVERQTSDAVDPSDNAPPPLQPNDPVVGGTDTTEPVGGGGSADANGRVKDSLNTVISRLITEDPPNINVSQQNVRVAWHPRNGCADEGKEKVFTNSNWYEPTFWKHDLHQASATRGCYQIKAVVHDWFKNTVFCDPLAETDVHYSPTVVRAFANGSAKVEWKWSVTGDCAKLLNTEAKLFRRH